MDRFYVMDMFYVVVYASSGSGGLTIREFEFCDEVSLKEWLKQRYACSPDVLAEDLIRGRLYIYRGKRVVPKIRKVTIDEIDLRWG